MCLLDGAETYPGVVPDAVVGAVEAVQHLVGPVCSCDMLLNSCFHDSPAHFFVPCWKAHPNVVTDAVVGAVDVVEHLAGQRVLVEE